MRFGLRIVIKIGFPYIFYNEQGHKFEISLGIVEQMAQFVQHLSGKYEGGGVMLGRFIVGSEDVVVDKITKPMIEDKQSQFRFFRSRNLHQAIITEEWEASGGTCNYLGEWHTHPESNPKPSFVDKGEWKKKLFFDQFDSDFLYFVIVGTKSINVWQGYRNTSTFKRLMRLL